MAEVRRFEPVEIPDEPSAAEKAATVAAASAIGLALKALSQRAIAAELDKAGIPTRSGRPWHSEQVARIRRMSA